MPNSKNIICATLKVESIMRISPNPGGQPVHIATLVPVPSKEIDPQTGKKVIPTMPWARLTVLVTDPAVARAMVKGQSLQMNLVAVPPAAAA